MKYHWNTWFKYISSLSYQEYLLVTLFTLFNMVTPIIFSIYLFSNTGFAMIILVPIFGFMFWVANLLVTLLIYYLKPTWFSIKSSTWEKILNQLSKEEITFIEIKAKTNFEHVNMCYIPIEEFLKDIKNKIKIPIIYLYNFINKKYNSYKIKNTGHTKKSNIMMSFAEMTSLAEAKKLDEQIEELSSKKIRLL